MNHQEQSGHWNPLAASITIPFLEPVQGKQLWRRRRRETLHQFPLKTLAASKIRSQSFVCLLRAKTVEAKGRKYSFKHTLLLLTLNNRLLKQSEPAQFSPSTQNIRANQLSYCWAQSPTSLSVLTAIAIFLLSCYFKH